jgi:O-Antigen ligase
MLIFLICVAAFMVSGDIFFVVHVDSFTVRIFQLAMLPILGKGLFEGLRRSVKPVGFGYLLLWTGFVLLFIPNTTLLNRSLFYGGGLVFSVLMVLGLTAVVDTPGKCRTVLQWYIYSFVFSAVFGLSQIVFPFIGLRPLLVQQWWFTDSFARINGFTYEPSYYATYMLTGWVLVDYLRYKKYKLRFLAPAYLLITVSLILCSSRSGWLLMFIWLCIRIYWYLKENRISVLKSVAVVASIPVVLAAMVKINTGLEISDASFLISGLGLMDKDPAYSSQGRWDIAMQTLRIYLDHPLVGVSLGGIAPAIARQNYSTVVDNDDAKANEGMCTTIEILAASGTVGFCFYALYVWRLIGEGFRVPDESSVGKALTWALIFLLLILQADQNILRSYVWFHIGLASAVYSVLSRSDSIAGFAS